MFFTLLGVCVCGRGGGGGVGSLNKNASIPLLYILAKAKSLTKQLIVWRPIAAAGQPFILRHWLRPAARAFTLTLVSELATCFLHLCVTNLAEWVSA